jgi:hypothetical protein
MKKIVIKMRSMKKLFGDDLLQLALLLSLMKVRVIDVLASWPPQLQESKKVQNKNKKQIAKRTSSTKPTQFGYAFWTPHECNEKNLRQFEAYLTFSQLRCMIGMRWLTTYAQLRWPPIIEYPVI